MNIGDSFLADFGCGRHLYIVISDPAQNILLLATMISTYDEHGKDDSCILYKTDGHPWIKHQSYIAYNQTIEISTEKLEKLIQSKQVQLYTPFSSELVQRILKGAEKSDRLKHKFWIFLDNQHLFD